MKSCFTLFLSIANTCLTPGKPPVFGAALWMDSSRPEEILQLKTGDNEILDKNLACVYLKWLIFHIVILQLKKGKRGGKENPSNESVQWHWSSFEIP